MADQPDEFEVNIRFPHGLIRLDRSPAKIMQLFPRRQFFIVSETPPEFIISVALEDLRVIEGDHVVIQDDAGHFSEMKVFGIRADDDVWRRQLRLWQIGPYMEPPAKVEK